MLEQADCEVVCAAGAPAALAALEKSRFDLVLCDRHVPYARARARGRAHPAAAGRALRDDLAEDPAALADEALARGWTK